MDSREANKAMMRQHFDEVWNKQNLAAIDEIYWSDYVVNYLPPWRKPGASGHKEFMKDQYRMLPDAHFIVDELSLGFGMVKLRWLGRKRTIAALFNNSML
jgi:hypothetical protein